MTTKPDGPRTAGWNFIANSTGALFARTGKAAHGAAFLLCMAAGQFGRTLACRLQSPSQASGETN
uniref:hypothetical protein n=1 Tax=Klebsiella pneumoniae TaxID=573 RepID=UPI0019549402